MNGKHADVRAATIRFEDGILCVTFREGARVTLEDAMESLAAYWSLVGSPKRVPVLVDMRRIASMSDDARRYFSGAETEAGSMGAALVIDSPISKVIANFMIAVNKPPFPTRMFTDPAEALDWLRALVVG